MTVAGLVLLASDVAAAWADTATFDMASGKLRGHVSKLAINPLAAVVCSGSGWREILAAADAVVHAGLTMDGILEEMPRRLQDAVHVHAATLCFDPGIANTVVAICGFSHRAERVLAWTLRAETFFAPELVARWASPAPGNFAAFTPACAADVAAMAQRQVELLREQMPDAGAGVLTSVVVRPDGITVLPAFDLAGDSFLAEPPRLSRHVRLSGTENRHKATYVAGAGAIGPA